MKSYLAIDAGGTYLKSAVLDAEGNVFSESACSTESFSDSSRNDILQAFSDIIVRGKRFIEEREMIPGGIGIAFPGPFHIARGTPLMKHKFQSLYGLNLREHLYETGSLSRDIPVSFIHDANAVLVGEIWKGNARGFGNAAAVTLGTGLGFAVSENGRVLCNDIGGPYCSIYNYSYKDGILEDYTAKRGFIRIYSELAGSSGNNGTDVADIALRADRGDKPALQTFSRVGEILAESLRDILIRFGVECLVFSGQISHAFHHLEPALVEGLKDAGSLRKISQAKDIKNAALFGAVKELVSSE